jgi:hypothetical protein
MNSVFDIELQANWRRERLLAEADTERMASLVRAPRRSVVRARLAARLYALADWLSADMCARETARNRMAVTS